MLIIPISLESNLDVEREASMRGRLSLDQNQYLRHNIKTWTYILDCSPAHIAIPHSIAIRIKVALRQGPRSFDSVAHAGQCSSIDWS
jgi:hypothetical protein